MRCYLTDVSAELLRGTSGYVPASDGQLLDPEEQSHCRQVRNEVFSVYLIVRPSQARRHSLELNSTMNTGWGFWL